MTLTAKNVEKLIDAKAKGQKRQAPPPQPTRSNVIDIVAAPQENLATSEAEKTRCCLTPIRSAAIYCGRRLRRYKAVPHGWRHQALIFWPSQSPHLASADGRASKHVSKRRDAGFIFRGRSQ
jgi:hypothetical protein